MSSSTYDEVPYASYPFAQSHPDRLALMAHLLGIRSPNVEKCRVLELGCASGGNLLPMAQTLPESEFIGVDLSEKQIAVGHEQLHRLGMKNIQLIHTGIENIDSRYGFFDYIICHGVFSWVPRAIQDAIMQVCRRHLNPTGVAYISYNTLPGWRMRGTIRDMMLYHTESITDSKQRIEQSMALLDFMARSSDHERNPYGMFLKSELESLRTKSANYIFHDHLEQVNDPCYFHEFVSRATGQGLRLLGEADLPSMVPGNFPATTQEILDRIAADQVHLEQYMDFLRNRMFRQTLLCHREMEPSYSIGPDRLTEIFISMKLKLRSRKHDLRSGEDFTVESEDGLEIHTREPIIKAALSILAEHWPKAVSFGQLRSRSRTLLADSPIQDAATIENDTRQLAQTLVRFYSEGSASVLDLRVRPIQVADAVSPRPATTPLIRDQARLGNFVTNLRHETVHLGEFERQLLQRLDGEHPRERLVEALMLLVRDGQLTVEKDGEAIRDANLLLPVIQDAVQGQLAKFARQSILVSLA